MKVLVLSLIKVRVSRYTLSTKPRNLVSISNIGSIKGSRRVLLLEELASRFKKPEPILVSTLEEDEDNEGDIIIKDPVNITIIRSAKVNTLPKFKGEVGKLKEFITKL